MNQLKKGLRIRMAVFSVAVVAVVGFIPSAIAATPATPTPVTLTLGSTAPLAGDVVTYAAMGLGLFQKAGITLNWAYNATSAPSLLVSGQAQLLSDRPSNALVLESQGQSIKFLSPNITDADPGWVGSANIGTLQDLINKGTNCQIGIGVSGSLYEFTQGWVQKFGIKCQLVSLGSYTALAAAGVCAGTYQAVAEVLPLGSGLIAQCPGTHWLIDPSDPNYFKDGYDLGLNFINSGWYTTTADLASDKDAITRFFQVEKKAYTMVEHMQPDAVATAVQNSGIAGWQSMKLGDIEASLTGLGVLPNNSWQNAIAFNHITLGPVPQQLWADTLIAVNQQGAGLDITNPSYSYANIVDTSVVHSVFGFNTTKYISINPKGKYSSLHLTARHGSVTLIVKNGSTVAHGLEVTQKGHHGFVGKAAPVGTGATASLTLTLPPATYYFLDTNSSGSPTGVKGTLIIS